MWMFILKVFVCLVSFELICLNLIMFRCLWLSFVLINVEWFYLCVLIEVFFWGICWNKLVIIVNVCFVVEMVFLFGVLIMIIFCLVEVLILILLIFILVWVIIFKFGIFVSKFFVIVVVFCIKSVLYVCKLFLIFLIFFCVRFIWGVLSSGVRFLLLIELVINILYMMWIFFLDFIIIKYLIIYYVKKILLIIFFKFYD